MLRRTLSITAIAVFFALAAGTPPSRAAVEPAQFVGNIGTQGIEMLGQNVPPAQRIARFRQLFETDFDVPAIGRFVLGRYWRELAPEQQQEFLQLLREVTVLAYSQKLGPYGGSRFQTTAVQQAGDEIVVGSQVLRSDGKPVQMDWHLVGSDGDYKVTDVYVDGVSMKVTQRDEFASIIQKNGGNPETLLAVLREELRNAAHGGGPGR